MSKPEFFQKISIFLKKYDYFRIFLSIRDPCRPPQDVDVLAVLDFENPRPETFVAGVSYMDP